jgi:hypothetical protein
VLNEDEDGRSSLSIFASVEAPFGKEGDYVNTHAKPSVLQLHAKPGDIHNVMVTPMAVTRAIDLLGVVCTTILQELPTIQNALGVADDELTQGWIARPTSATSLYLQDTEFTAIPFHDSEHCSVEFHQMEEQLTGLLRIVEDQIVDSTFSKAVIGGLAADFDAITAGLDLDLEI